MVKLITVFLFLFVFLTSSSYAYASYVFVDSSGEVTLNVLSIQDDVAQVLPEPGNYQLAGVTGEETDSSSGISLQKSDGRVVLTVNSSSSNKVLDVTDINDELVEIEERPEVIKMSIGKQNDSFYLKQKSITALTPHQINLDPESAKLSVVTQAGEQYLGILPYEAAATLLRSDTADNVKTEFVLSEDGAGSLVYTIAANKVIDVFNVYSYSAGITAKVSAITGEIVSVEEPVWVSILDFMFS